MSAQPVTPAMMPTRRPVAPPTPPRRPLRVVRPQPARVTPTVGPLPSYTPESRHPSGPCGCGCDCQAFTWDMRAHSLPSDPPRSCECGHPAHRHTVIRRLA